LTFNRLHFVIFQKVEPYSEEESWMSSRSTTEGMIIARRMERERKRNRSLRIALMSQFCPQQKVVVVVRGRTAGWH
jgi:hypothetical protein